MRFCVWSVSERNGSCVVMMVWANVYMQIGWMLCVCVVIVCDLFEAQSCYHLMPLSRPLQTKRHTV